jgi:hypothetical protein
MMRMRRRVEKRPDYKEKRGAKKNKRFRN